MYSGFYTNSAPLQGSTPTGSGATVYVSNAAELSAALKAAKGGETILLKSGTYDPVALRGIIPTANVTIASADPANQAVLTGLVLNDSKNITVRNVDMFDKSPAVVSDFLVQGGTNIHFDHVKIYSVAGDAGYESAPFLIRGSKNVSVTNSEITHVRHGIAMLNNDGVTISNNYIHDLRTDGVRGGGNSNITITDNYFTEFHPAAGDHPDAIQFWTTNTTASAENIRISGNAIMRGDGSPMQGIFMGDEAGYAYKNVVIDNNIAVGTMYNGIAVANAAGLSVTGNTVVGMPDQMSWIRVPSGTTLTGNGAERYIIGGVTVNFPAANQTLPAVRDGGLNILTSWINGNLTGGSPNVPVTEDATKAPPPPPTLVIAGTAGADTLRAAQAEDSILRGGDGADKLYGQVVQTNVKTTLEGGKGDDVYFVNTVRDTVVELANGGSDTVHATVNYTLTDNVENLRLMAGGLTGRGNGLDNKLVGSIGGDIIYGQGGADTIQGLDGNDRLYGGDGDDRLFGDQGADYLFGDAGNDTLSGDEGNDWLEGGAGNDRIEGGAGADWMAGGAGADTFLFRPTDLGQTDTIADFARGQDIIALSVIDANSKTSQNEAFKFVGTKNFSKTAGELRYTVTTDGVLVQGDVNGDGIADLSIKLLGLKSVAATDFLL